MHSDDLFTAPQVAKICSTDLKTIHNWVNRGEIKFFRTPGRHLRFRRQDIVEFLTKFGYPIPAGFAAMRPRVVMIDNNDEKSKKLEKSLRRDVDVELFEDRIDAMLSIGKNRPALVLVNGESGGENLRTVERLASLESGLKLTVFGVAGAALEKCAKLPATDCLKESDADLIRRRVLDSLGI